MPSLKVPESGLSLGGSQNSSKPDSTLSQGMFLTLSDSVIEDMIKCVRNGKAIQLSLGLDPKILYGSKTQHLAINSDPFTHELYRTDLSTKLSNSHSTSPSNNSNKMPTFRAADLPRTSYFSKLGKIATPVRKPVVNQNDAVKSQDEALAQLKKSMALAEAQKLENTTTHVKDISSLPPAVQQRGIVSNKKRFLNNKSLASGTTRSMPTSPSLTGINSPALGPTSAPPSLSQMQAERAKVARKPIIHQLALGPATQATLMKSKPVQSTDEEFKIAIDKVADLKDGKYTLIHKYYRELDVFKYKYASQDDREVAINNAIRVYDKLRLNSSEPEWDRLLPDNERGMGKCLSKLQAKIAVNAIPKPPKIVRGEESGRDTGAEDNDDLFGEKSTTSTLKSESIPRSHSQPPTSKPKKVSEKEAQAKRLLAKPGASAKSAASKPSQKAPPEKTSSKIKSSKFVSESDEEDDYLIPVAKPSTPRPSTPSVPKKSQPITSQPMKRPRDDAEVSDTNIPTIKKPKTHNRAPSSSVTVASSTSAPKHRTSDASQSSRTTIGSHNSANVKSNTSPQKSSPLASSPPTNATDLSSSQPSSSSTSPYTHPSLKRKPAPDSDTQAPYAKKHYKSTSVSTTSSTSSTSTSSSVAVWDNEPSQAVKELAAKFNLYYQSYKRLYRELERDEERRHNEMSDLLDMQQRLDKMKKEILQKNSTEVR